MTLTLDLVLLVVALICFLLAAFDPFADRVNRVNLVAFGLAAWVLTALV